MDQPTGELGIEAGRAVERLEEQVRALSREELEQFRAWLEEFDWDAWDVQVERDAVAGRLDDLAAQALGDYAAGRTTRF